jgi:hypothetical protein
MLRTGLIRFIQSVALSFMFIYPFSVIAEEDHSAFTGVWYINEEFSDDTDKQVEEAIKEAGGKIGRTKKKGKGRYKGGPPEQALYDHISYDEILHFDYDPPEFRLRYEEGFERVFHSDNRRRSASARGSAKRERKDFAFASWSGANKLFVESRPRDGGRTSEVYTLVKSSQTGEVLLQAELNLNPLLFSGPIYIKRIYQRAQYKK